jgi:flagellar hook-length control protein FliK
VPDGDESPTQRGLESGAGSTDQQDTTSRPNTTSNALGERRPDQATPPLQGAEAVVVPEQQLNQTSTTDHTAPINQKAPAAAVATELPSDDFSISASSKNDAAATVPVVAGDTAAAPIVPPAALSSTVPIAQAAEPVIQPSEVTAALTDDAAEELWGQVSRALHRVRPTADGNEVRLRLRPAELGELLVNVQANDDGVSVRLVTTSNTAQQTLAADSARLKNELHLAGFGETSVDVSQQDDGRQDNGQPRQGANEHGRRSPRSNDRLGLDGQGSFLPRQLVRPHGAQRGVSINLTL